MFWTRLLQWLTRAKVRKQFDRQGLELRDQFLHALQTDAAGQPAVWHELEWITEPVIFVRQDRAEPHYALVGVSGISSDPAGGTSKVESRAGTAVFQYSNGAWTTNGQLLLNLTPSEALEKLMHQFMQIG